MADISHEFVAVVEQVRARVLNGVGVRGCQDRLGLCSIGCARMPTTVTHTIHFCPVEGEEVAKSQQLATVPCPYCGTPLPPKGKHIFVEVGTDGSIGRVSSVTRPSVPMGAIVLASGVAFWVITLGGFALWTYLRSLG